MEVCVLATHTTSNMLLSLLGGNVDTLIQNCTEWSKKLLNWNLTLNLDIGVRLAEPTLDYGRSI